MTFFKNSKILTFLQLHFCLFLPSAWTSALELATLTVDTQRACLVLSSGISDRWRYAFYSKTAAATEEAKAWEAAKKQSGGLHFLAIQSSLESEDCDGFWLLKELSQPEF